MAWICRKQFIVAVYDVVFPPAQKRGMVKFPGKGHFMLSIYLFIRHTPSNEYYVRDNRLRGGHF